MFLDNVMLKARAKALASEIQELRRAFYKHRSWLNRQMDEKSSGYNWESEMLYSCRKHTGQEARYVHLARMFLRGRVYKTVEASTRGDNKPSVRSLLTVLRDTNLVPTGRGGPIDEQAVRKWLGLEMPKPLRRTPFLGIDRDGHRIPVV